MDKKEQVIESARELFTNYGYKRVSMDEIALKANVTKKTIYSYFKDKNELLQYFLTEQVKEMKAIIEKNEKKSLSYSETINMTIYSLLNYRKKQKMLISIARELGTSKDTSVKEYFMLLDMEVRNYIKNKLVQAIEDGHIKECDVNIAAFLIHKIYIAIMFEWDDESHPIDEKEAVKNILNILETGLFK